MERTTRERHDESTITARVMELFDKAGFETDFIGQKGDKIGRLIDFTASREELGQARYYGIVIKLRFDPAETHALLRRLQSYQQGIRPWDEKREAYRLSQCWVITQSVDKMTLQLTRTMDPNIRVFSLAQFERVMSRLTPRAPPRTNGTKARTRIGKSALLNQKEIEVLAASLVTLIEEKINALNATLLNDLDSIARKDASVTELGQLRAQVKTLAASIEQFKKGETKEKDVVKSVTSFSEGVQAWWSQGHVAICSSGYSVALFTTAMSVCSLAGVQGKSIAVIAGALAGGKPLIDALKSAGKRLFGP